MIRVGGNKLSRLCCHYKIGNINSKGREIYLLRQMMIVITYIGLVNLHSGYFEQPRNRLLFLALYLIIILLLHFSHIK